MTRFAWLLLVCAGCGGASEESGGGGGTTAAKETAHEESEPDPSAVPPEKFEEIDRFFHGKGNKLQFNCYNTVVEKTKKKYEGVITFHMMVEPHGKAGQITISNSTLKSPEIEQCVVDEMKSWEWPDVPSPVPYNGAIGFKPAW